MALEPVKDNHFGCFVRIKPSDVGMLLSQHLGLTTEWPECTSRVL